MIPVFKIVIPVFGKSDAGFFRNDNLGEKENELMKGSERRSKERLLWDISK